MLKKIFFPLFFYEWKTLHKRKKKTGRYKVGKFMCGIKIRKP